MMTKALPPLKSRHNKYKVCRVAQENEDRFSELPDELLQLITSSFTTKEVARFSLVSRRCELIWRCVPVLIFEKPLAKESGWGWKELVQERPGFVRRVDSVLAKHLGTVIDELRISYGLGQDWQSHVDNWAAFALDKKVKRLELDFSSRWRSSVFNRNGLVTPICGEPVDLPPIFFTGIKSSLTSLCLKDVNVTDGFIDCLPHSCPLLENLCIVGSNCLTRVSGSFDQVKHLEVSRCCNIKIFNISARKLQTFVSYMQPIELLIADASPLSEVSIGGPSKEYCIANAFNSLSKYFSQLVHLTLGLCLFDKKNLGIDNPVAMPNLQHLELGVRAMPSQSLRGWVSLIAASQSLQKLKLKVNRFGKLLDWPICKWVGSPLKCLKTFEIVGYVGEPVDLELAFFVLENANMLEEVIVDFVPPHFRRLRDTDVRERLVKLQMRLPEDVKLIVK